ncbi:MAG: 50S ribosomal protein L22, partial [Candidatus Thermoplasmatota archaeon]|nr:50S ribosomal protein L22 [Candidatus Thermoplasmatota archaeon]
GIPVTGGYPVKVAKAILKVLESAEANAVNQEMDPDEMKIKVIAAHRARVIQNFMPRAHGRATPFFRHLVNIEVILETTEEE